MLKHTELHVALNQAAGFAQMALSDPDEQKRRTGHRALRVLEQATNVLFEGTEDYAYGLLCLATGLMVSSDDIQNFEEKFWWIREKRSSVEEERPDMAFAR